MKIITGSSKVVQGTGETQSATVPYEFGVKGSEQKRVRDRSIVQGTVLLQQPPCSHDCCWHSWEECNPDASNNDRVRTLVARDVGALPYRLRQHLPGGDIQPVRLYLFAPMQLSETRARRMAGND